MRGMHSAEMKYQLLLTGQAVAILNIRILAPQESHRNPLQVLYLIKLHWMHRWLIFSMLKLIQKLKMKQSLNQAFKSV